MVRAFKIYSLAAIHILFFLATPFVVAVFDGHLLSPGLAPNQAFIVLNPSNISWKLHGLVIDTVILYIPFDCILLLRYDGFSFLPSGI